MKIALLQLNIHNGEFEKNAENSLRLAEEAVKKGASLVLLPEMFICGFSFFNEEQAKKAEKLGLALLEQVSKKHSVHIAGTLPLHPSGGGKPANAMVLCHPDGTKDVYNKLHLFSQMKEGDHYRPGHDLVTVRIGDFRVTLLICYDLRFPQTFARLAPQTDLYVVLANWPSTRMLHWQTLLRARAIENQAYVMGVNRVGSGNELEYVGGSLAIAPEGKTLAEGSVEEQVIIAEADLQEVVKYRREFPLLRDRLSGIDS